MNLVKMVTSNKKKHLLLKKLLTSKFYNLLVICMLVIFIWCSTNVSHAQSSELHTKNEFLAGILSLSMPGLGQFYADSPFKGSIFWLSDNLLFWTAVLLVVDIKIGYEKDLGFSVKAQQKSEYSDIRIIGASSAALAFVLLRIYDVIDAVSTAKDYNEKLVRESMEQKDNISLFMNLGKDGYTPSIGLSYRY